jgi:hydroxypyruvate reductase
MNLRAQLRELFLETLERIELRQIMTERLRCERGVLDLCGDLYALDAVSEAVVIAVGKAAAEMAAALEELAGAGRLRGLVAAPAFPEAPLTNFHYFAGGHPYPNAQSREAAHAALRLVTPLDENALVIYLLSGGGSALFEKPLFDDIGMEEVAAFNRALVTCGANIYEMNVLRKHFSAVKGGRLAAAAFPARQVTLYVSDVPAGKPSTIASGPTMADESTIEECYLIAARYGLTESLPDPYAHRLRERALPETPKPGEGWFEHSRYHALLDNEYAVEELAALARRRGWQVEVDLSCDDWPYAAAADHLLARLHELPRPACLISGGELSCPVTGPGVGGRNQHFALYCATRIAGQNLAVLSAGTDGIDGNSPAAGAVAAGATLARAAGGAQEALARCDSHTFFAALGDAIITGPTGNNVRDLRILLAP